MSCMQPALTFHAASRPSIRQQTIWAEAFVGSDAQILGVLTCMPATGSPPLSYRIETDDGLDERIFLSFDEAYDVAVRRMAESPTDALDQFGAS